MLREPLAARGVGIGKGFRLRGREIQRIEGFSDAVLAFAMTLLVVSLEVPRTFSELLETMNGFVAFALAFALLLRIWFLQYQWFRRYGLEDGFVITLNGALLFVVLFFVYPLKFLFGFLVKNFTGQDTRVLMPDGTLHPAIAATDMRMLMIVYGLGYIALFGAFWLLYNHAWRRRDQLDLSPLERFDTLSTMYEATIQLGVGVLSVLFAFVADYRLAGIAGLIYMLLAPLMTGYGMYRGRQRKKFETIPTR
ncbi:MAG TPA: TMEM175 family protein [Candidatus Polarisedimenticolia bacterium]|nr:TMEM175 family protein [Candidatus Polarisedimenticolia bacterium]